jgi:hypothetical protein
LKSAGVRDVRRADLILALTALAIWTVAKWALFRGLEYTSDLFSTLQMSYSWIEGQPVLYENAFGPHGEIHNYYGIMAFAPLTKTFGAYGLFAGAIALMAVAVWLSLQSLAHSAAVVRYSFVAILVGPAAFSIWDDPVSGFHPEMLFLPSAILLAIALMQRSAWRWPIAAFICMLREEGPIIACLVYLLYIWSCNHQPVSRSLRGIVIYAGVFVAGMVLLIAQGGQGRGRLAEAFANAFTVPAKDVVLWAALVGPLIVLIAMWADHRLTAIAAVSMLAVGIMAGLGAALYRGDSAHGMTWAPRLALAWGVGMAALLFAGVRARRCQMVVALVCGAVVLSEVFVLRFARDYRIEQRIAVSLGFPTVADRFSAEELEFLRWLARSLTPNTPAAMAGDFFAIFHRHSLIWPNRVHNAWLPPVLVVCDSKDRVIWEYGCGHLLRKVIRDGYAYRQHRGLAIAYRP